MNKVWKYSVIGILCAGGLYTGVLDHVEKQVTTSNQEKTAYMKKVQERNDLIKKLNGSNKNLYKLELAYNQITNAANQKSARITTLKSDISQIQNQIKAISNSIQTIRSSRSVQSAHSSTSTPLYASSTSSSINKTAAAPAPTVSHPSIVVSVAPPVVQSTTKAS